MTFEGSGTMTVDLELRFLTGRFEMYSYLLYHDPVQASACESEFLSIDAKLHKIHGRRAVCC